MWEKTKTLVSGSILTKPAETSTKASVPPPANSKSLTSNSWLEDNFDRAKIVEDILKKTHLKQDEESDPKVEEIKVPRVETIHTQTNIMEKKAEVKENRSGNGKVDKVAKLPVLEEKKRKETFADSNESDLNFVIPENESTPSEKYIYETVPAVETTDIRDVTEHSANSVNLEPALDHSLKSRVNTREPKSSSFDTQAADMRNEGQYLSEETKDVSKRQEKSSSNKEKPEEVLSDRSTNILVVADSTESKITSDTDDSFSLGTIDLSQVSNQCDTPAHSNIRLDSIPGLDDMNSQDTSPFKSMSDEDF